MLLVASSTEQLPPTIAQYTSLQWLDLDRNQIKHIDMIRKLRQLQRIHISNNNISVVLPDVFKVL